MTTQTLRLILVAGMLACGSAVALAQQGPGRGPGMGPGMGMGPGTGMGPGMMGPGMGGMFRGMGGPMGGCGMMGLEDGKAYTDGRLAFLRAELGITEAQKAAWDGYAAAFRKNLEGMQAARQTMMSGTMPTSPVERLDLRLAMMESRLAALKELKPALGTLYAALGEEQKKKADDVLTSMGCMM